MPQNEREDRARARRLALVAVAAMIFAYLPIWMVLSDPNMTAKLMNGAAPPGTAVIGNRIAAILAILSALGAWAAAVASRRVIPVLLVLLASVPFAPIALFTLALAL